MPLKSAEGDTGKGAKKRRVKNTFLVLLGVIIMPALLGIIFRDYTFEFIRGLYSPADPGGMVNPPLK